MLELGPCLRHDRVGHGKKCEHRGEKVALRSGEGKSKSAPNKPARERGKRVSLRQVLNLLTRRTIRLNTLSRQEQDQAMSRDHQRSQPE
jgi:hypothetical protein